MRRDNLIFSGLKIAAVDAMSDESFLFRLVKQVSEIRFNELQQCWEKSSKN